jgi:hypothetical protein
MISQKKISRRNENAFSGLELIILLTAGIIIFGYIGYGELTHGKMASPGALQKQKQGMIPNTIIATSNLITDPGGIAGFPAVDGIINGVPVRFRS